MSERERERRRRHRERERERRRLRHEKRRWIIRNFRVLFIKGIYAILDVINLCIHI